MEISDILPLAAGKTLSSNSQSLAGIGKPADIQRLVAGQLEETLKRFENAQRKSGKTSAAGYFLLFKVLMYLTGQLSAEDFAQMAE